VDEDVATAVGVARDEVARLRAEGDEAAVTADPRVLAALPSPPALSTLARPVADEHVERVIGVAGDEVRRERAECDEATVGADVRRRAATIALPRQIDADGLGRLRRSTVDDRLAPPTQSPPDELEARRSNATTLPSPG
jgi:hypothetical protein